jgi:hypothetical protein
MGVHRRLGVVEWAGMRTGDTPWQAADPLDDTDDLRAAQRLERRGRVS